MTATLLRELPHIKDVEHDHSHDNHHTHEQPQSAERGSVVSKPLGYAAALGSLALSIPEMLSGMVTTGGNTAIIDGGHNAIDSVTTAAQARDARRKVPLSPEKQQWRRKAIFTAMSVGSLAVAAKTGVDRMFDIDYPVQSMAPVYTTGASLGLSVGLASWLARNRAKSERKFLTTAEQDFSDHVNADLISAGVAFVAAAMHRYSVNVADFLTIGNGLWYAHKFRPTKTNLQHTNSCLGTSHAHAHGHGHGHNHDHTQSAAKQSFKERWHQNRTQRIKRGLGLASLALTTVLLTGGHEEAAALQESAATTNAPSPTSAEPQVAVTEYVSVQPGDSQWRLVERQLKNVTNNRISATDVNALTRFTIEQNRDVTSSPHRLKPNQQIEIPTIEATRIMYDALHDTSDNNQPLRDQLNRLNYQSYSKQLDVTSLYSNVVQRLRFTAR